MKIEKNNPARSDAPNDRKKEIDYLQKVYPWKSRELIAKAMEEGGSNNRKILKILSTNAAAGFGDPKRFGHPN